MLSPESPTVATDVCRAAWRVTRRAAGWGSSAPTRCRIRVRIPCAWRSRNSGLPFRGCWRSRSFSSWRSANIFSQQLLPVSCYSGESRPGNPCRAEVAARAERDRSTRWRVETRARRRIGPGRCSEAVAWCPRMCTSPREKSCATNPCSLASWYPSKWALACKPLPGRWYGAMAEVTTTGARSKFGRTAELVRTAHVIELPAEGSAARGAQSGCV
jgi:hypothetical protein